MSTNIQYTKQAKCEKPVGELGFIIITWSQNSRRPPIDQNQWHDQIWSCGPLPTHETVDRTSNDREIVEAVKAVGTVEEASGDHRTVAIDLVPTVAV